MNNLKSYNNLDSIYTLSLPFHRETLENRQRFLHLGENKQKIIQAIQVV